VKAALEGEELLIMTGTSARGVITRVGETAGFRKGVKKSWKRRDLALTPSLGTNDSHRTAVQERPEINRKKEVGF